MDNKDRSAPAVPPLDVDAVRTVQVGTGVWLLALLSLLPFTPQLADDGRTWWLWTCVAGVSLGLAGLALTTRRRRRIQGARSTATD